MPSEAETSSNPLAPGPGNEVFRRMVDHVREYAIFMLSPQGVIASWNQGAERIKGYTASEAIGRHFSIFYTQDALDSGWPDEELRRAVAQGHFEDEGWRVRKDGSRFWANVIITTLRGENGELLGFSKVTRDLTERREQERRLHESERSLRLLVESVQDYAIFMLDAQGTITSWNLGAQRIKGYTAEEAIGRHFSMFYLPEDVARGWPQDELTRADRDGRYEEEGWRLSKDGKRIWANVVITKVLDERGDFFGFSKVTRDLTERRRHEEERREREENLQLLVEGVKDHAMFLLDDAGLIQTWNAGAQRVLGQASQAILKQDVALLYRVEDRAAGQPGSELASAREAGSLQTEGWRQRANGTAFWADISTTALRDPAGQVRGFVQIIRDLSERRRVEDLETEGRRISEFIAMLSHELRNPLAPIRNAVAILKRFVDKPEAAWCAELIGRQVVHMTRLVDDLLDVSRITSGKIRLETTRLDLNEVVRLAVDSVGDTVQAYGHTLDVQLPPDALPIMGDATRLTQVVVNLLTNSAKYTPKGGRIKVTVDQEAGFARLQVSDNGIGMGESLLEQAFEPFVQGERALDRAEGGLGIGLTLVKRIVELHGGTVCAASAGPEQGSTLTVKLPILHAATAPSGVAAPLEHGTAAKVLLVDDNKDLAESMAMILDFAGHTVRIAHDGPEALRMVTADPPDVVLLDLGLPGMDGYQVAQALRAMPALARTRLIAITGYGQARDRQATADAGFTLHLTKPVDPEELTRLIEQH